MQPCKGLRHLQESYAVRSGTAVMEIDQLRAEPGFMNLVIAATQRCGSTMILEDLRNACVFGMPEEYFIPWYGNASRINIQSSLQAIARKSRGPNNFNSVKIMADQLKHIENKLSEQLSVSCDEQQFMPNVAALFKEAKWVFVQRKDVLRQAISRHMSAETNVNHATQSADDSHFAGNLMKGYSSSYNKNAQYSFDKIKKHCQNIVLENITWSNFFAIHAIKPLTLSYEVFSTSGNYDHLLKIAKFVGSDFNFDDHSRPKRKMVKLSNSKNDDWYLRFLCDINQV